MPSVTICLADDPEWKPEHRNYVTGSEVAAVLGESKWKNRDQVLVSKVGTPEEREPNRYMWWGSEMERANMKAFSKITGVGTVPSNVFLRNTENKQIAATLDGFCHKTDQHCVAPSAVPISAVTNWRKFMADLESLEEDQDGIIEMKNTNESNRSEWLKAAPYEYWVQAQVGMFCADVQWGVVCAKIGADDMRMHVVHRDDDFLLRVQEEVASFWQEVEEARKDFE